MRSFLIVLATAVVSVGAFAVYWSLQPKTRAQQSTTAPAIPDRTTIPETINDLGPGTQPWMNTYDKGRLTTQFTAEDFQPQKDGSVTLKRPKMLFYTSHGYVMVSGDDGVLDPEPGASAHTASGSSSSAMLPGAMPALRNGRLFKVEIQSFPTRASARPTIRMWTNNVRYVNDTLTMVTEQFSNDDGDVIPGDRVPVTVRGDQYDFDGNGLTIQFDGKTHRMQLLQVQHGRKVVIKNTKAIGGPVKTQSVFRNAGSVELLSPDVVPNSLLASTDPDDVRLTLGPGPKPAPPPPPVYHRAVFNDDVQVRQGDHLSAQARAMAIDFVDTGTDPTSPSDGTTNPTENPPGPATGPEGVGGFPPVTPPTTGQGAPPAAIRAVESKEPTVTPAPLAATTQPADKTITITWTGKLRVTELTTPPMMPLEKGEAVVQLVGSPARLTPVGSTVTAASATYRSGDGALVATSSDAVPWVTLARDKGITLTAKQLAFDPATSVMSITGPSRLVSPEKDSPPMVVTWYGTGLLHTFGDKGSIDGVDQIDLADNVTAADSRVHMTARRLRIDLEPADKTARPKQTDEPPAEIPRRMLASGDVKARFTKKQTGKWQEVDAHTLDVGLVPDGKGSAAPRLVTADRDVLAFDPDQSMTCDHLEATLAARGEEPEPADDSDTGSVELESLLATGRIHARTATHGTADGSRMRVTTVDGKQLVELWDNAGAVVNDGKGKTITGSVIHFSPDRGTASVDGPGTITSPGSPKSTDGSPGGRPFDVSWADSMSVDSKADLVEVVGRVAVRLIDKDGGVTVLRGDTAHIDLEDVEPSEPTTRKSDSAFGGNKQPKRVVLAGHVTGESLLQAGGAVIREGSLDQTDRVIYTAADQRIDVPGPGRMLVENHKPAASTTAGSGNNRGVMAMSWNQSLSYDQSKDLIDVRGGVRTAFVPDTAGDKKPEPMKLNSDRLLVKTKKPDESTTKPADGETPRVEITSITAVGAVRFVAHGITVDCHQTVFDPATQRMVATGSNTEPGHASGPDGGPVGTADGSFESLTFDTANQEVVNVKGLGGTIRK